MYQPGGTFMNPKTHYRRCQHCGATHKQEDELLFDCDSCGKELVPLYYSHHLRLAQKYMANSLETSDDKKILKEAAVVGLTADWESEPDAF
jgi:predicted RNA-binding Zn-ribbon protein involved in translation (DUF1610 family)